MVLWSNPVKVQISGSDSPTVSVHLFKHFASRVAGTRKREIPAILFKDKFTLAGGPDGAYVLV